MRGGEGRERQRERDGVGSRKVVYVRPSVRLGVRACMCRRKQETWMVVEAQSRGPRRVSRPFMRSPSASTDDHSRKGGGEGGRRVSESSRASVASEKTEERTLISSSYARSMFLRWIFCAAVTIPLSGVHSSNVNTSAPRLSIGARPACLPVALI